MFEILDTQPKNVVNLIFFSVLSLEHLQLNQKTKLAIWYQRSTVSCQSLGPQPYKISHRNYNGSFCKDPLCSSIRSQDGLVCSFLISIIFTTIQYARNHCEIMVDIHYTKGTVKSINLKKDARFRQCVPQNQYNRFLPHLDIEIFWGFPLSYICSLVEGSLVLK